MSYSVEARMAFESTGTLATLAVTLLRKHFGDEFIHWDPTTIYLEIRDEFGAEPSSVVMDRVSAAQVAVTTDSFFDRVDGFGNIANTFSSGEPGFVLFDPVGVEEAAWAIVEVSLLRELLPFGYSVRAFLRTILDESGFEGDYPTMFNTVFGDKPDSTIEIEEAQASLRAENRDAVEAFVDDQLRDLIHQFNKIPGMGDDLAALMREQDLAEAL